MSVLISGDFAVDGRRARDAVVRLQDGADGRGAGQKPRSQILVDKRCGLLQGLGSPVMTSCDGGAGTATVG